MTVNQEIDEYDEMLNDGVVRLTDRLLPEQDVVILINEKRHSDLFFAHANVNRI